MLKLHGLVGNQEILILIDTGSSSTFISDKAVQVLQCSVSAIPAISVTMANGQKSDYQSAGRGFHLVDTRTHLLSYSQSVTNTML